jgi:DNA-binding NarL/FixJ family response regulator
MDPPDNDKIFEMLNETGELSRLYNMPLAEFLEHLRNAEELSAADRFLIGDAVSSIFGGKRILTSKDVGKDKATKRILFMGKYGLTDNEMNTLEIMARGLTYAQIADELGLISFDGVNKRVQKIFRKLGVNNRHQAVDKARSEWLA